MGTALFTARSVPNHEEVRGATAPLRSSNSILTHSTAGSRRLQWQLLHEMADGKKGKGFPDVSEKLSALPKKSLFERQRAEAEAKRALEEAETAAVYEDFVKSFQDEGDTRSERRRFNTSFGSGPGSYGGRGRPMQRHFASNSLRKSGPGTLGPPPSSSTRPPTLPPTSTLPRKRNPDGSSPTSLNRDFAHGGLGSNTARMDSSGPLRAFRSPSADEDETLTRTKDDERAAPKPALYLAALPPGTSPSVLKSLIPAPLEVDNVNVFPPPNEAPTDRKFLAAIVTLASDTASSDIDSAVKSLQNKYLGCGYYLTLSRHLSSAALGPNLPTTIDSSNIRTLPFGAKMVQPNVGGGLNRAPPPGPHRGGIAPPSSYGPASGRSEPFMQVEVKIPTDIKQLRLIHSTIERVLTDGPIFEAVLMNVPEVQKDEKFYWLWDARSPAGVYYRWRLWQLIADPRRRGVSREPFTIFDNGPLFVPPKKNIKFEFAKRVEEFVSHPDYDTSEDEKSEAEEESDGPQYLNPFRRAKLAFLLARLPTTHAKLRRGDIARVTAFAIKYAGVAPDEVVEVVVLNILTPLAYTRANPNREKENQEKEMEATNFENEGREAKSDTKPRIDMSSAKLVGLYAMSDIMLTSSEGGVRHAWRYRQLFESALRERKVFEHLGRLEKDLEWGRLKAEKWKRSVGNLLQLWESRSVFTQSSHEQFVQLFENPPLTEEEAQKEREKAEAERAKTAFSKGKSRWKAIDPSATSESHARDGPMQPENQSQPVSHGVGPTDNEMMNDIDGVPIDDSDLDGIPIQDSDLDGILIEDSDLDGIPMEDSDMEIAEEGANPKVANSEDDMKKQPGNSTVQADQEVAQQVLQQPETASRRPRKPRPKAEDMFASDSD